jgi:hypothetical protein
MSQVKISGNASGTGVLTISAPNTNTDRSITIPDKAGAIAVGAGTIVQVVHASTTTNTSTTSSTFTDTALSASITPTSSSNKIMVHIVANSGWSRSSSASWAGGLRILRDSTVIETPSDDNGPISFYTATFGQTANPGISRAQQSFFAYDSPATTSSTTYKAQIASRDGVAQVDLNTTGTPNATSHIILMEVVA